MNNHKFLTKFKINNTCYIILLILISILIHLNWFNPNTILSAGDWYYWPLDSLKQLYYSWGSWINYAGFGSSNIQIPFNIFMVVWSLLANHGFGYEISSKLTFFIPIAIFSYLAPFILAKKITKTDSVSFISALFYGTTTVVLVNQLPFQFVFVFTPLIIYFFMLALEINSLQKWFIFVFSFCVSISYEVRIMYIVLWILIFYFLFFYLKNVGKYIVNIFISGLLLIFLNLFWILPTIISEGIKNIDIITKRGLFGGFLFDLPHAFTVFSWLWTGNAPNNAFVKQPVFWYFWLIPLIAFSVFLFNKESKFKREILFFCFISLIGIFFTKQSAAPLSGAYEWFYVHFPGFSLYREASKFYLFTIIGYLGLISYNLISLKKSNNIIINKYLFGVFALIIILIALINMKPLLLNKIGGLSTPRQISRDYLIFEKFISQQPDFYRTLWTPTFSRWSNFNNQKPRISNIDVIQNEWKTLSFTIGKKILSINEQIMEIYKLKNVKNIFDLSSIKYVIVPLQDKANDDDFFVYYGNDRNFYIKELARVSWLKKINIGTKELVVYENEGYRPHIYSTSQKEPIYKEVPYEKVAFQFKNPTEYEVSLKNVSQPFYLNFSEAFHPDWKLRIGEFNWFKVLTEKNYFISDKNHFENDAKLNSFYIDPVSICKTFECKKNSDGTYDINITLYFRPQSYMYLGLIISGLTLFVCLSYIGFLGIRKLKMKKK